MRSEPRARRSFSDAARTAGGGAALTALVTLAGAFLAQRALVADAAQAFIAEWGATRLGVAWSESPTPTPLAGRRALEGMALGLAAGGFSLGFARATGAVTQVASLPSVLALALPLLHSSLLAVRDELLLHGIVLHLLRRRPFGVGLLACGAASSAWAFGTAEGESVPLAALVVAGLAGAAFGALWAREKGAWRACGAHATWALAALLPRTVPGAWGGGSAGLFGAWATAVALVPMCVALGLWVTGSANRDRAR
jgi:hypothetical protein